MTRCKTYLAEMSSNLREPPDDGGKEDQAKKSKRAWSRHAAAARARAGALLGINYDYLRTTCPQLPQTGYLSRSLKGQWPRSGRYRKKFGT